MYHLHVGTFVMIHLICGSDTVLGDCPKKRITSQIQHETSRFTYWSGNFCWEGTEFHDVHQLQMSKLPILLMTFFVWTTGSHLVTNPKVASEIRGYLVFDLRMFSTNSNNKKCCWLQLTSKQETTPRFPKTIFVELQVVFTCASFSTLCWDVNSRGNWRGFFVQHIPSLQVITKIAGRTWNNILLLDMNKPLCAWTCKMFNVFKGNMLMYEYLLMKE